MTDSEAELRKEIIAMIWYNPADYDDLLPKAKEQVDRWMSFIAQRDKTVEQAARLDERKLVWDELVYLEGIYEHSESIVNMHLYSAVIRDACWDTEARIKLLKQAASA